MVGGQAVPCPHEHPQPLEPVRQRAAVQFEEGRPPDVGGRRVPVEKRAARHLQPVPECRTVEECRIAGAEAIGALAALHEAVEVLRIGPYVAQEDRGAVGIAAQRLVFEIHVDAARQRKGHHERRRGEVIAADRLVDAPLEVAIAGQHGGGDQIALADRSGELGVKWSALARAGGAAVAHDMKTQRLQRRHQPLFRQIIADEARAGRERGLDPRRHGKAARHRVARQQPGGQHDRGVGGIGAGGDRRDDDRAVAECVRPEPDGPVDILQRQTEAAILPRPCQGGSEAVLQRAERDPVLRAAGARDTGHDPA